MTTDPDITTQVVTAMSAQVLAAWTLEALKS